MENKVYAEIHYYDAKGRQYRLEHLANELRQLGIEVISTGFDGDYDGYINITIDREQARMLDNSKYGKRLNIVAGGKGATIDEQFDNALRIEKLINK